jgi:hypothetical protein
MFKRAGLFIVGLIACLSLAIAGEIRREGFPDVLSVRERAGAINQVTRMRLETLLPRIMEKTGFDMWIIACNEDHLDAVFKTMVPYDTWSPITQILVFYHAGSGKPVERLNISRTNMRGLHADAWDVRSWDMQKKEDQWSCLGRIVGERDPKKIAINESGEIWAADGLTASMKQKIIKAIGPAYEARLHPGERLSTLWLMTLLDEELDLYEKVVSVAHALIAETYSEKAVTPGVTTIDDLLYYYLQKVSDLGLENYAWPSFRIRGRTPEALQKYGKDDRTIRRGDFIECDVGIRYLRYYTDHCEWAYVLRPGETDAPPGSKKVMAEGNRLQDIFCGEFKAGLSGNQILRNILDKAQKEGIAKPMIYSHSIGYYLHEPGPLIGLPWEQADTGARGEVRLVPNSTFTAELSVTCPVPELGGQELRVALEQIVAFTPKGTYFVDGRQTEFHLIK